MLNLKQRRMELGLTMLEVAELVGVSEATISRYESGNIRNMRRERIAKYARALQVSPADFLEIDEDYIKTHELLNTITDNENTSQQQKDKDAYINGMIDASKAFDSKPEFPPKKKFKHMGAQPIKIKNNAPTAVGESELFNYLKQTYSTDELKELASLPRDKAVEIVKQAKKLNSK